MPADHGLASLGLAMQLFGSVFAGALGIVTFASVLGGAAVGLWMVFSIGAIGAIRSVFHRMAGTALVYGSVSGPFRAIQVYVGVSVAQTALTLLLFNKLLRDVPAGLNVALAAALLAWPLALLLVTRWPRLRRFLPEALPSAEDMGFEGAAVLMIVFGSIGALFMLVMLWSMIRAPGVIGNPTMLLLIATLGMLLVRSILHVTAGVKGTSGVNSDGASDAAARYYNFGVVSSVVAGAVFLIFMMMIPGGQVNPTGLLFVCLLVYLLLIWPLLLRRFYTERNFGAILAGSEEPNYRRAPDAGLTSLGWLLFAFAVYGLATSLPSAIFRLDTDLFSLLPGWTDAGLDAAARSPWWSVGASAIQLWAALELIGMTDRYKLAGTAYGAIATGLTVYVYWPMASELGRVFGSPADPPMQYLQLAVQIAIPVCTLILVHRKIRPMALARIREPSHAAE
jgi:hypothetical protein